MKFVPQKRQEIYNSLSDCNELIQFLYDIFAFVTVEDYYKIHNYSQNKQADAKYYVNKYNKNILNNLADEIYAFRDIIENSSIDDLESGADDEYKSFRKGLKEALAFDTSVTLSLKDLRELIRIIKELTLESFFQNNWDSFLPEIEVDAVNNNTAFKAMLLSFMKEFDKIDALITKMKNMKSYEDIPIEYINYLTQLLGFEQKHFMLTADDEEYLRVIAKNILDIYSHKSTYSSFELLFKFLGFNVKIKEYYFDRRRYYSSLNSEFNESRKTTYKFYLTQNDPRDNIETDFELFEQVNDSMFSEKLRVENFDDLVEEYGIDCVLGFSDTYTLTEDKIINGIHYAAGEKIKYEGDVYKYFKTNYIILSPKKVLKAGEAKSNELKFTTKDNNTLFAVADFLTPEFWQRDVIYEFATDNDKFTVNGIINSYGTDKNGNDLFEGFRMFDSEKQIYKYEFNKTEKEKEKEKSLAKARLLNNGKYTYYIKDNTPVSEEALDIDNVSWLEYTDFDGNSSFVPSTEGMKLKIYTNSVGETCSSRTADAVKVTEEGLSNILIPMNSRFIHKTLNRHRSAMRMPNDYRNNDIEFNFQRATYIPVDGNINLKNFGYGINATVLSLPVNKKYYYHGKIYTDTIGGLFKEDTVKARSILNNYNSFETARAFSSLGIEMPEEKSTLIARVTVEQLGYYYDEDTNTLWKLSNDYSVSTDETICEKVINTFSIEKTGVNEYKLKQFDNNYRGLSDDEDADSFVLYNHNHNVNWNIFDNVDIENKYGVDPTFTSKIERPTMVQTENIFNSFSGEDKVVEKRKFFTNLFKDKFSTVENNIIDKKDTVVIGDNNG